MGSFLAPEIDMIFVVAAVVVVVVPGVVVVVVAVVVSSSGTKVTFDEDLEPSRGTLSLQADLQISTFVPPFPGNQEGSKD